MNNRKRKVKNPPHTFTCVPVTITEEERHNAKTYEPVINLNMELYLQAYKDQEFQHAWRRYLGRAVAILAAIIPPISLIFFIYRQTHDEGYKKKPSWLKVGVGALFALVPILSGMMSWRTVDWAEERRRINDDIQKSSSLIVMSRFEAAKKLEKDNRKYIKNGMTHIDWEALREEKNTVKKPKKVVIIYQDKDGNHRKDEYMDSPQKRRREKLLGDNDNSTCTTEFFKQSYKQSADIVEKLQKNIGSASFI